MRSRIRRSAETFCCQVVDTGGRRLVEVIAGQQTGHQRGIALSPARLSESARVCYFPLVNRTTSLAFDPRAIATSFPSGDHRKFQIIPEV